MVTSTSLTQWYVPQDLPRLPEVLLNVCGAGFVFDPSSPCHYHVFGLGIAWNECSYIHREGADSFQAWTGCVKSCAFTGTLCNAACAAGVPKLKTTAQECLEECSKATNCLQGATLGSKSQEDASDAAGNCLKTLRKPAGSQIDPSDMALLEQHQASTAAIQKTRTPVRNLGMFSEGCELLKVNGRWRAPLVVRASVIPAAPAQAQPAITPLYSQEMASLAQDFQQMITTMKPPGVAPSEDALPPVLDTPPKEIPVRRSNGRSLLARDA